MSDSRPDPDALLARVQRDERKEMRGKLKIFFGAAAGVGKTFAMLQAAHAQRDAGTDTVVGLVETHGRSETIAQLEGLEILPSRSVEHRGGTVREFDIDAALARKPGLLIVDELAHSNAAGSRHPKRWQDIAELVEAGIDVYTSLNVQHLESLNDVVGQITGVRVWETIPDKVFDEADEVELVDLPPDELLARLAAGKVYLPEQAQRAAANFFRKGNLIALRELSLRRTAQRVDAQMRDYREDHAIDRAWPVSERLLVCVGPGERSEHLVRAARRLAAGLNAEWTALYVETPDLQRLPEGERDRILRNLRLAEELGARSVTVGGGDVAREVVGYARAQNVSKIVLGKPRRRGLLRRLVSSTVDRVLQAASDIDVEIIGTEARPSTVAFGLASPILDRSRAHLGVEQRARSDKLRWPGYAWATGITVACTLAGALMHGRFELTNMVMVYLAGIVLVAVRFGRGPSAYASLVSVAAFDFFFVPPYLTFAVSDTQYVVTFAVMLTVGLVISNLAASVRLQARIAGYREQRISALYEMSRELAGTYEVATMVRIGVQHLAEVFASQAVILLPEPGGRLRHPGGESISGSLHGADLSIAQWVYEHNQAAGLGTETLAGSDTHFVSLASPNRTVGVIALLPANPRRLFVPEQRRLLDTFAGQIAIAIERAQLAEDARAARLQAETEELRNSLLSGISHDLRTPLASIVGASSTLAESAEQLTPQARRELATGISDEARHMSEVVANVLDLARYQAGAFRLNLQWHVLDEVVGAALARARPRLGEREVKLALPADAPLVQLDAVLIEQVLVNLLENAAKYTPPRTTVTVAAETNPGELALSVSDNGPGLRPGEEEQVFEKFYRGSPESATGGVGLGLAICRSIVEAHGGVIRAGRSAAGGARFSFTLPQKAAAPVLEVEE
jgi:two-component system sensor histidine kinase KdpD